MPVFRLDTIKSYALSKIVNGPPLLLQFLLQVFLLQPFIKPYDGKLFLPVKSSKASATHLVPLYRKILLFKPHSLHPEPPESKVKF